MQILILANSHGSTLEGHCSPEITVQNILTSYFWPSLASIAETIIHCCPDCYINADRKAIRTRVPLKSWPTATRRNAQVHVDLVGPFRFVTNNVYVLTLTDTCTGFTRLVPLPNKEAKTVAEAITNEWIL